MARNINYLLVDAKTGFIKERVSVPHEMLPSEEAIAEGLCVVVPAGGDLPRGQVRFDLRKIRSKINHVASVDSVRSSWRPAEPPAHVQFEVRRYQVIYDLDRAYARQIETASGPLAALHAEKRRQAEAGAPFDPAVMPLVADEADRLAILANAAIQDEAIAAIERERREIKARLKVAATEDEMKAATAFQQRKSK